MPLDKPMPQDILWQDQLPQQPQALPSPQQEALQPSFQIPQFIKQSALPVVGAMAGGAGAPIIGLPPVVGQSIGGGLGEGINQLLGITEPSWTQIGINAAMPAFMQGLAGSIGRGVGSLARISDAGRIVAQSQAINEARGLTGIIKTAASEPIYEKLSQQNVNIPLDSVSTTVGKLSEQEQVALEGQKIPALNRILKGFTKKIVGTPDTIETSPILDAYGKSIPEIIPGEPGGNLSFRELWTSIKRIGSRIDETQGTEQGALKKIYGSLWDDLNKASTTLPSDIGGQLRIANQAYRKEMASVELAKQIEKAISPQAGTGNEYINVKGILNWINKSPDSEFFQKSLSGTELDQIKNVLYRLIKTPSLPAPDLTPIGSGKVLGKVIAEGGLAGVATTAITGSPTAGAVAGAVTPFAISKGSQLVSKALLTKSGRQFLIKLMDKGPIFSSPNLGLLGEFMASQTATPVNKPDVQGLPSTKIHKIPDSIGVQ